MTPSAIVVDTSVLVAAVTMGEPHRIPARALLAFCTSHDLQIIVPALALAEFCGVLSRTQRPALRARRLLAAYRQQENFTVLPVEVSLAEKAAEIALLQRVRGADAVFLALAGELMVPLVTLDREQRERAPEDVEVFAPDAALAKWFPA